MVFLRAVMCFLFPALPNRPESLFDPVPVLEEAFGDILKYFSKTKILSADALRLFVSAWLPLWSAFVLDIGAKSQNETGNQSIEGKEHCRLLAAIDKNFSGWEPFFLTTAFPDLSFGKSYNHIKCKKAMCNN